MSLVAELLRSRRVPQVAALALVSAGLAGCSADSARFAENPFASQRQQEVTGAVNNRAASAPVARVESRPMPQYQSQALPPPTMPAQGYNQNYQHSQPQQPAYQPQQQPYRSSAAPGNGRAMATYQQPQAPSMETTGSAAPRSVAAAGGTFSAADGQSVIVGTNDTVDTLASRYNVPAREIMRANGLPTPRSLQPGQQLVIPKRMAPAAVAAAPAPARPATLAAAQPTGTGFYSVRSGETLNSIARKNNVPVATLAKANNLTTTSQLKIGSRIVVPGMKMPAQPLVAQAKPAAPAQIAAAKPATPAPKATPVAAAPTAPVVVASAGPVEKVRVATETKEVEKEAKQADATGGLPSFRWPVRGRVIGSYGARTNGKQNDGINVAVPEGTPIKAAEDGVVTYAGNELKGYGNLVLVRHSNGYVTAYAHASELAVKRGETIKRGQTLGKAGQTGDVSSPQVHFEIRQGSNPVDPTKFLNGA